MFPLTNFNSDALITEKAFIGESNIGADTVDATEAVVPPVIVH